MKTDYEKESFNSYFQQFNQSQQNEQSSPTCTSNNGMQRRSCHTNVILRKSRAGTKMCPG